MKSKEKKVEENIDLSKMNYNEFIKHLDSQGVVYKKYGNYFSDNVRNIIYTNYDYSDTQELHYFCVCGTQVKPNLYLSKKIIMQLLKESMVLKDNLIYFQKRYIKSAD